MSGVEAVVREFQRPPLRWRVVEGQPLRARPTRPFFGDLARGVVARAEDRGRRSDHRPAWPTGWRLEPHRRHRARAVLRCGVPTSCCFLPQVPREVVINEYLEITKSFFDGPEPGFINGVLDGVIREAAKKT